MLYRKQSLLKFSDDLAAKMAAPGGGAASANVACLGVSLMSMVINFTIGKRAYSQHEPWLKDTLRKSESLRKRFLELVDLDVQAFSGKDMRKALDIPFIVCRLSFEAARLCQELLRKSNVNLSSDVGVAAALLDAAFSGAYLNVKVNLKIIGDKALSGGMLRELSVKKRGIAKIRAEIENGVGRIIEG